MSGPTAPAPAEEPEPSDRSAREGDESPADARAPLVFLATLTGVFAFLGYKTEDIPSLVRNDPFWIMGAGVFALLAGFALFVSRHFRGRQLERTLHLATYGLLAVGTTFALVTGVRGYQKPEYPFVEGAAFRDTAQGMRVEATLKAARLRSSDRVMMFIDTLVWKKADSAAASGPASVPGTPRSRSNGGTPAALVSEENPQEENTYFVTHRRVDSFGPDEAGRIQRVVSALLPPGDYRYVGLITWLGGKGEFRSARDCYNQGSQSPAISCVVLSTEHPTEEPQLSARWLGGGADHVLRVELRMDNTEARVVQVTVTGLRPKARRLEVAAFSLRPSLSGAFSRTLDVPVPRRFSRVCVVARAGRGPTGCPLYPRRGARRGTVWTVLRAPSEP